MPGNIEVMTTRIVTYLYMGDDKGIRDATALAASLMILANSLLFFMTWMLDMIIQPLVAKVLAKIWLIWANGSGRHVLAWACMRA